MRVPEFGPRIPGNNLNHVVVAAVADAVVEASTLGTPLASTMDILEAMASEENNPLLLLVCCGHERVLWFFLLPSAAAVPAFYLYLLLL